MPTLHEDVDLIIVEIYEALWHVFEELLPESHNIVVDADKLATLISEISRPIIVNANIRRTKRG